MSFIHANDAAMGVSKYERHDLDFYPTPSWVTEAAMETLKLLVPSTSAKVWEPGVGTGAMADVIKKHYPLVIGTDIKDYGYPGTIYHDFLTEQFAPNEAQSADVIMTNPPFGDDAEKFIVHALQYAQYWGSTVAMLLRHEYDTAKGRVGLFNKPPFACKLILTTRPRWIPLTTGAPRHSYAWYFWSQQWVTSPIIRYHVVDRTRDVQHPHDVTVSAADSNCAQEGKGN